MFRQACLDFYGEDASEKWKYVDLVEFYSRLHDPSRGLRVEFRGIHAFRWGRKITNNNLYWNLAFLSITVEVEVEVVVVPMTSLLIQKAGVFLLT